MPGVGRCADGQAIQPELFPLSLAARANDECECECVRIGRRCAASVTVERSKFFAVLVPVASEGDVLAVVRSQKAAHRKAVHHCWALRVKTADGQLLEKAKDDGEVGHPGRVLLELLRHADMEGALVVSRVFGGVKLGVGGVSRAFREAGAAALAEYEKPA
jgi:putative IMPACT (imprinted ancient) family translation regulator